MKNQSTILELESHIDTHAIQLLEPHLRALSQSEQSEIIIDMTKVNFIDSSGIGAIVFLYKALKARGREIRLMNVSGQPKEMINMLGINKVIGLFNTTDS